LREIAFEIDLRLKKNKEMELVWNNKVVFLANQETKLEIITPTLCYNLWGSEDCEWAFQPFVGNSGVIISIWQKLCLCTLFAYG